MSYVLRSYVICILSVNNQHILCTCVSSDLRFFLRNVVSSCSLCIVRVLVLLYCTQLDLLYLFSFSRSQSGLDLPNLCSFNISLTLLKINSYLAGAGISNSKY